MSWILWAKDWLIGERAVLFLSVFKSDFHVSKFQTVNKIKGSMIKSLLTFPLKEDKSLQTLLFLTCKCCHNCEVTVTKLSTGLKLRCDKRMPLADSGSNICGKSKISPVILVIFFFISLLTKPNITPGLSNFGSLKICIFTCLRQYNSISYQLDKMQQ